MNQCILLVGNILEGYTFIGPFDSLDEAEEYGDTCFGSGTEWMFATLSAPSVKIESPSGWSYMSDQENGDNVDCHDCGNALNDDRPIVHDANGYAYHGGCLVGTCYQCGGDSVRIVPDPDGVADLICLHCGKGQG